MEVDYESPTPKKPTNLNNLQQIVLQQIVLLFLQKANSEEEWNSFCDKVKMLYGGNYPEWWGQEVLFSGLLKEISQKWQKGKKKPKWNNLFNEEDNV